MGEVPGSPIETLCDAGRQVRGTVHAPTRTGAEVDAPLDRTNTAGETAILSHSTFKRPQSVLVVICTQGGDFLMLRRAHPNRFWQSVTGSLAAGESPRLAAVRELREETGIEAGSRLVDLRRSVLFPIVAAWRARYAPGNRFNREYWFALVLESRRLIRLNTQEHLEYRWLPARQAADLASSRTNRDAIRLLAGC